MTPRESKRDITTLWIPVGAVVGALLAFFWAGVSYAEILTNQKVQGQALQRIETKVDSQSKESVSIAAFRQWLELLKARNPSGISIPDYPK